MDRIAKATGGLFNLKEIAKAKDKRKLINSILGYYRQNCVDQGISSYMFETDWNRRLESKGVRDIKNELRLLETVHNLKTFTNP